MGALAIILICLLSILSECRVLKNLLFSCFFNLFPLVLSIIFFEFTNYFVFLLILNLVALPVQFGMVPLAVSSLLTVALYKSLAATSASTLKNIAPAQAMTSTARGPSSWRGGTSSLSLLFVSLLFFVSFTNFH